jgi:hypothetical protein
LNTVRFFQLLPVDLDEREPHHVVEAGRPVACGLGFLEMCQGHSRVLQGQVAPPESVVAGARGGLADGARARLDLGETRAQKVALGFQIVERQELGAPHEELHLPDGAAKIARQRLALRRDPQRPEPEARDGEGRDDRRQRQRHSDLVFARALPQAHCHRARARPDRVAVQETLEILRERLGRLVPRVRGLLEALEDDGLEIERNARLDGARRGRGLLPHHPEEGAYLGRREWSAVCQHVVEGRSEPVDIGPPVQEALPAGLFRRHERGCALHAVGGSRPGFTQLSCDPEVGDVRFPRPVLAALDEHVAGLHVPVDDAEPVRFVDRERHLLNDADLLLQRERRAHLVERVAVHVTHHDERDVVGHAGLEHLAYVRVEDAGLRARLLQEAAPRARVAFEEQLHRDGAPQADVARAVHGAHASPSEELEILETLVQRRGHLALAGSGPPRRRTSARGRGREGASRGLAREVGQRITPGWRGTLLFGTGSRHGRLGLAVGSEARHVHGRMRPHKSAAHKPRPRGRRGRMHEGIVGGSRTS